MDLMDFLGAFARLAVPIILVTSSIAKLRSPTVFAETLRALGLHHTQSWWLAICAMEFIVAVGVVAPVAIGVTVAMISLVGLVFAAAGLRALTLGRAITCACFGASHSWSLGWLQLFTLPVWLAAAFAMSSWVPVTATQRAGLTATILSTLLTAYVVRLLRAAIRTQRDRQTMNELERITT